MRSLIQKSIDDSIEGLQQLHRPESLFFIEKAAETISHAFNHHHKIIAAGNGGSLCDAAHLAEEFTGFYRKHRRALPAIALTDPGHITCVGNDAGFEWIFSRGLEALGQPGDVFIGLTTSGNSANIVKAFETAKERGLKTLAFLGREGGQLKGIADFELCINGFSNSDRIQEAHMAALHIIIEMVEYRLFPEILLAQEIDYAKN